jgi:hypothetical protein
MILRCKVFFQDVVAMDINVSVVGSFNLTTCSI